MAELVAELRAIERDSMYVYNLEKRVGKLIAECAWVLPKDVTGESFAAWRGRQKLTPKTLKTPEALASEAERLYSEMVAADIPKEDARFILPNATTSEIVISANFREFRHIIAVRCHPRAHWEIRMICLEILRILKREAPIVFWDYEIDEVNHCVTIKDE